MSTIKIENKPNANGQRELTKEQFIEKIEFNYVRNPEIYRD